MDLSAEIGEPGGDNLLAALRLAGEFWIVFRLAVCAARDQAAGQLDQARLVVRDGAQKRLGNPRVELDKVGHRVSPHLPVVQAWSREIEQKTITARARSRFLDLSPPRLLLVGERKITPVRAEEMRAAQVECQLDSLPGGDRQPGFCSGGPCEVAGCGADKEIGADRLN